MKVAIRVDASLRVGTGHVMRCLTLAGQLRASGAAVRFVCRNLPESLAQIISDRGHEIVRLPDAGSEGALAPRPDDPPHAAWLAVDQLRDARETQQALANSGPWDWIVVDHYALDARWEQALREAVGGIFVIDDLADRPHECDVLLDQNFYLDADSRYDRWVSSACVRLLGPRYALLRDEFRDLRRAVVARDGAVRRLLVFFGGMDSDNVTGAALEALSRLDLATVRVDVVIGGGHPAREAIEARCRASGLVCHVQTHRMGELMATADLALGAGGTATWERCALGLPTMALCLAENQRQLLHDGSRAGLIHAPDVAALDAESLALHLAALLANAGLRNMLSRNGLAAVDGRGAARVIQALGVTAVNLRPAGQSDSTDLLAWRNDPAVRAVSRNSEPIGLDGHHRWLASVLADPKRPLLIGSREGQAVGVVRFDLSDDEGEVSIYLAPGAHGRGAGSQLLLAAENWLRLNHPQIRTISAEVLRDNGPSHRLFEGCGYAVQTTRYTKRIQS